jgi:cyclopropane fatty-acyl-phospholipid synthase-like methyltransferase
MKNRAADLLHAPAADRNKAPILEVLRRVLPAQGTVLEVASGTGQHVVHFAAALPGLRWIPSDPDPRNRASIAAHVSAAGLGNVAPSLDLDVLDGWGTGAVDAVIVANLLHVSPREVLPALCSGAASVLVPGGILHIYGPFKRAGRHTSEGNARFDASLRAQDPGWGLWNLEDVLDTAHEHGLEAAEVIDMPANNLSLLLRRRAAPPGGAA